MDENTVGRRVRELTVVRGRVSGKGHSQGGTGRNTGRVSGTGIDGV